MRANKKNHAGNRTSEKMGAGNREKEIRRENRSNVYGKGCCNIPDEEILGAILSEIFNGENGPVSMTPLVGVIELDGDNGLRVDLKQSDSFEENANNNHFAKTGKMAKVRPEHHKSKTEKQEEKQAIPGCDGCGEEAFLSMLADLNTMMRVILEQDHMMRMVCEEDVDPEDARCITWLGVHKGREILKKWNRYRNCGE